jgi:hypothetical protein
MLFASFKILPFVSAIYYFPKLKIDDIPTTLHPSIEIISTQFLDISIEDKSSWRYIDNYTKSMKYSYK